MSDFWKDKRVCVTGGAGFLGSFVVEKLTARGAKDVFIPRQRNFDLTLPGNAEILIGDWEPDIVIHLAALVGGIGTVKKHPADFFYKNLIMGVSLLHAAYKSGVDKFVAIGSVCSYPKFTPIPFREENIFEGYPEETNAPYGFAKRMLMVQSSAYAQQYDFNSINLIMANMYGPRDNFDLETSHVIPALIRKFTEAKARGVMNVDVWGDGSATREFLYADDAANAILLAAEKYNDPGPVNVGVGSTHEISIKELVEKISKLAEFDGNIVWDTSKPNGQPRRGLDVSKAKELFGFEASIGIDDGLCKTVDWYNNRLC